MGRFGVLFLTENRLIIRIVFFLGAFDLIEIEIGAYFNHGVFFAHHATYNGLNFLLQFSFDGLLHLILGTDIAQYIIIFFSFQKHIAARIHHHHIFGLNAFHTISYQSGNAFKLIG